MCIFGEFTDPRDNNVYKTVKIGEQVWMAENFAYDTEGGKCYDSNPANAKKYGRLYDWETAKELCPSGWGLPSRKEWQELLNFAGVRSLRSIQDWRIISLPHNGTDEYGFTALPGGYGYAGYFCELGKHGRWWSSSEEKGLAYFCYISYDNDWGGTYDYKEHLFSVRYVKD